MTDDPHGLFSERTIDDPMPVYATLRRESPVYRWVEPKRGVPIWLLFRHADGTDFLRDPRFTKDVERMPARTRAWYAPAGESFAPLRRHLLGVDPPDHTRLRALAAGAFTKRQTDRLRERITQVVDELLERMAGTVKAEGSVDFMEAFAMPLPETVIAELLGIPQADQGEFRQWIRVVLSQGDHGDLEELRVVSRALVGYFEGLVSARRASPSDDLTSALIEAEAGSDRLTGKELLAMMFLLVVAGRETTVNLLGNGLLTLTQHREQLRRLIDDPKLIASGVEEMLRYHGPMYSTTFRYAVEDTPLFGVVVPAGEAVRAMLLSANRDPEAFEDADRFDVGRSRNRHIAFGAGIHFCLGAPLARLEAQIAFSRLLSRFPQIDLQGDRAALRWRGGHLMRGLERLPVTV